MESGQPDDAHEGDHRIGRVRPRPGLRSRIYLLLSIVAEALLVAAVTAGLRAALEGGIPIPPASACLAYAAVALLAEAMLRAALPPRGSGMAGPAHGVLAVILLGLLSEGPGAPAAMLAWAGCCMAGALGLRAGGLRLARRLPWLSAAPRRIALIGNGPSALRLLRHIRANPGPGDVVAGFFDDRLREGPLDGLLPRLGDVDEIVGYIHEHELDLVYMALPWSAGERISQLLGRLRYLPLTVRLIPDRSPPALRMHEADEIDGVVMPTLMLPPFSALGAVLKRGLDIVASALLLVPLSVLLLAIAAIIRIDSPGPVFFRQVRTGQYGRPFAILKFRSLHVAQADSGAETLVTRGDRRVTRVGRLLRKYSIDELPQLLNVLLGDMSLVGPRPHASRAKADGRIYAEVMPDYMLRYRVKPGITGWAQVNGWRGNTDTEEKLRKRVEFDFFYIEHWSFLRDLGILMQTFVSVVAPPPENN